jgi:hypothetical protein
MKKTFFLIILCLSVFMVDSCASQPKPAACHYQEVNISAAQYSYIEEHWGSSAALSKGKMWLESKGVKFSAVSECTPDKLAAKFAAHGIAAPSLGAGSKAPQYFMAKTANGGWFIAWFWE